MSTFGEPADGPSRWVAVLTFAAAVIGIVLGIWVFAALT